MSFLRRVFFLALAFACLAPSLLAQYAGISPTSAPGLNVRLPLTTDPNILYPPARDLTFLPGDLMRITIYGVLPSYSDMERVSIDGTVTVYLGGTVKVGGLTLRQAEQALSASYEQAQTFHNAQVSIETLELPGHSVTLVGEVRSFLPMTSPRRLLDVLSASGGLPATASTVLQIDREGLAEPIRVDLGNDPSKSIHADIPIFPGDVITTGRVGQYYVVGAVNGSGARPLSGSVPTTVLQAVSAAGGLTDLAKPKDARLIRTVAGVRSVIPLDLRDVGKGTAPDLVLQSDDILLVPNSALKSILRLNTVTATIAIAISMVTLLRL